MASPVDISISVKPSPHDIVPMDSTTDVEPENPEASSSITSSTGEAQLRGKPHSTNLHALLASLKIPDGIKDKFRVDQRQPVNFVLVGKYQVGKSALINSMFYNKAEGYQPIAEEGDLEPTTDVINDYLGWHKVPHL